MVTHSLLTLLESKEYTKEFYEKANKCCYDIIRSNKYDFTKPLTYSEVSNFLKDIDIKYTSILLEIKPEDTVDDDVFGFAAQQYLVELAENADENQDKMFNVKKFLTYHMIYKEAMEDSPYDKVLRMLDGKTPSESSSKEPIPKHKTIIDDIDPKYINCKFTFKNSKSYQKPKLYKGCKFLKINDDLKNHYFADSWDAITITDDQGIHHQIKDSYPIFTTISPSIGDIVFALGFWIVIANKDILEIINNANSSTFIFYTTKFNNRKIETVKVKRFACGTLEKDISKLPYHVEIIYEDIKVNHNLDEIARHYNINHDKLIAKEIDIIKQINIALDHPLNVARSEWVLITGPSGSGKTTTAIEYANNKGIQYVIQQGHSHLSQDDFLGYTSIVKNDKDQSTEDLYVRSLLREAVEFGKVFIIDEIDGCSPNALLALNSLKNKQFQFPDKLIDIHPNFRLIGTANTLEYSDVYNGRSKLDKATLARFKHIEYDLEDHHLAMRYGLENIKDIKNINRLEPREIERIVTERLIEKELSNDNQS